MPPEALPDTLARLLRVDAQDPTKLVTVWPLDQSVDQLLVYANARLAESVKAPSAEREFSVVTGAVDAIGTLVATGRIQDLMQSQTAVVLPSKGVVGSVQAQSGVSEQALAPIYREVSFSIPALEARIRAGGQASADPFLFRHLAARLDRRMLDVLRQELGSASPLDLAADRGRGASASPLHLNLTLPGVLSDQFARLTAACRDAGAPLGVEVSLIEACADIDAFATARRTIREAGMTLVLDGVSHLSLLLARPAALCPDLLKLDWSPRMTDLGEEEARQVRLALQDFGIQRVVLHRAETEAALRWGLAQGIRRFQGRHVDAMLAASRILHCPSSSRCTLRQCIERASATGPAGRAGCENTALLDAGAPMLPAGMEQARLGAAGRRARTLTAKPVLS